MHHSHSKNILCPAGRATAFVSGPAAPSMSIFDEVLGGGRKISAFAFTLLTCMERNTYTDRQANNPFLQYFLFHSTGMADGVAAAISLLAPRHGGHHPKPSPPHKATCRPQTTPLNESDGAAAPGNCLVASGVWRSALWHALLDGIIWALLKLAHSTTGLISIYHYSQTRPAGKNFAPSPKKTIQYAASRPSNVYRSFYNFTIIGFDIDLWRHFIYIIFR